MSTTTEKPKGLYPKLLVIQQRIIALGKDSAGFNYKFVSGSKVLEHVKPIMNELGILLKQEILSIENVRQDYKNKQGDKSEILSKVMMRFTWIDCETGEKDESSFGANGQNDWDKGCGSAITYAERYFLLKYFHIATDEDDVDNPNRKEEDKKEDTKTKKEEHKKEEVPQMTKLQQETLISHAALADIFTPEQRKSLLEWTAKPQTFDNAQKAIEINEKKIIEHPKKQS